MVLGLNEDPSCKSLQVDSNTKQTGSYNEECLGGFTCDKPVRGTESLYRLVLGEPVWMEMNGGGKQMPAAARVDQLHFALSISKELLIPPQVVTGTWFQPPDTQF